MAEEADIDIDVTIDDWIMRQPELRARIEEQTRSEAVEIAAIAIDIAPIEHGDYVRSIGVDGSDVVATDFKSHWIEYGAERRDPPFQMRAPLRRAAELRGHRLQGGHR